VSVVVLPSDITRSTIDHNEDPGAEDGKGATGGKSTDDEGGGGAGATSAFLAAPGVAVGQQNRGGHRVTDCSTRASRSVLSSRLAKNQSRSSWPRREFAAPSLVTVMGFKYVVSLKPPPLVRWEMRVG